MISVHVMLHHARHGGTTEIARMTIANDRTGSHSRGNYSVETLKPDDIEGYADPVVLDHGALQHYARHALPVWYLVMCALRACGYTLPSDVSFGDPPRARSHKK
jgi:hypothetical protein